MKANYQTAVEEEGVVHVTTTPVTIVDVIVEDEHGNRFHVSPENLTPRRTGDVTAARP